MFVVRLGDYKPDDICLRPDEEALQTSSSASRSTLWNAPSGCHKKKFQNDNVVSAIVVELTGVLAELD